MPAQYRDFFGDGEAQRCFRLWLNECPVAKRRADNVIGRMIGRHPDEIHPGNFELWFQVWDERFLLMAADLRSRRIFHRPETPDIEDRRAP